jgi:hypothetical protein
MCVATTADGSQGITGPFLTHLDDTANLTKADIFLLKPKPIDDAASINNGSTEAPSSERLRLVIYGDMLTEEHAKIRLLIMIDQLVCAICFSGLCCADTLPSVIYM